MNVTLRNVVVALVISGGAALYSQGPVSKPVPLSDGQFAILRCEESSGSIVRFSIITVANLSTADLVLDKLRNGQTFPSLAREYSSHPTKSNGGVLPPLEVRDLREEFRAALAELGPCGSQAKPATEAASQIVSPGVSQSTRNTSTQDNRSGEIAVGPCSMTPTEKTETRKRVEQLFKQAEGKDEEAVARAYDELVQLGCKLEKVGPPQNLWGKN